MSSGTSATALPPIHSYNHPPPTLSPPLPSPTQSRSPPKLLPTGTAGTPPKSIKARACTNCKTKKIACRPGPVPGVCVKCHRDNKRCIIEEPTPRPVRGKGTSKARVAEMEKKLDGLVALLTGAKSISGSSKNVSTIPSMSDQEQAAIGLANLAPSLSRHYSRNDLDGDGHANDLASNIPATDLRLDGCLRDLLGQRGRPRDKRSQHEQDRERERDREREQEREQEPQPRTAPGGGMGFHCTMSDPKPPLEDVIGRNMVTEAEAEQYLATFGEMLLHFPFYVIPAGTTVKSLRRDKPILLLAILTAASSSNRRVQSALERDFRKVYSEKLVVNGEKSLELLLAGMVYLAWFHCHFSPKTQIFLQTMHLLLSLVSELSYDRKSDKANDPTVPGGPPNEARQNYSNLTGPGAPEGGLEPASGSSDSEVREFRTKEIRRATLGCWWLSNSISIDFRKRIPLHFSGYMRRCQQTFVDNPEFESDKYLVLLLRLQKLQEDACETFRYHEPEAANYQDAIRIQMSLKAFQTVLKDIERDIHSLDSSHPIYESIVPAFHSMGMYVYEIGLHMNPPPPSTNSYDPTTTLEWTAERISILTDCLSYAKRFLDSITTCSTATYRRMCSPSWMRVSYGLVVLSKLALGGTEPVDLCSIKEKTVIQYSNKHYTTLNPHPAVVEAREREREKELEKQASESRRWSVSPERPGSISPSRPGFAYLPSPANVDGWDTSVVRSAVRMEVYLDRLTNVCKQLHIAPTPIKEEDRERYKANGVEEICMPDLFDFGMWMFATMKEWYLAMVKREEEIEAAARDAVGKLDLTGGSGGRSTSNSGVGADSSNTPGGSIVSGGISNSRTRSTSVSIITPAGEPLHRGWATPLESVHRLKRKFDTESNWGGDGMNGDNGGGPSGLEYGNLGGGSGIPGDTRMDTSAEDVDMQTQMALPPTMGFEPSALLPEPIPTFGHNVDSVSSSQSPEPTNRPQGTVYLPAGMPCKASVTPPEYARDDTPRWVWDIIIRRRFDYQVFVLTPTFVRWEQSRYASRMSWAARSQPPSP
ncbi:hypothetical protein DRE_02926 [Drechslerella stenobrocha 248]|uniref:Zn(2)-C6 fungal-type domain-containing protein n=1 Tax=Drechslerella stenobrocha 248 TaxID=1043628 RepID=W7HU68_9PEZI|nr:hypothetical protein DRE_02926 [Drechslerella stenobrocha 248]